MMKVKTEIRGRTTIVLGLSHANLDRLREHGLQGYMRIDGAELEIPLDILVTAAPDEAAMLAAFADGITEGTKLRIADKLKLKS